MMCFNVELYFESVVDRDFKLLVLFCWYGVVKVLYEVIVIYRDCVVKSYWFIFWWLYVIFMIKKLEMNKFCSLKLFCDYVEVGLLFGRDEVYDVYF